MLNTTLNPCANLLYHWLLIHKKDTEKLPFDLVSFQAWSGEFLAKNMTKDEVLEAIYLLKNLKLINVENQLLYLNPKYESKNPYIYQLPTHYLLGKKTKKRNIYLGSLFLLLTFLSLWGGNFWFSLKTNTEVIPLSSFSVLTETDEN